MHGSTNPPQTKSSHLSYIPALDGLRAFGALPVMAMHAQVPYFSGGFASIDLFFVLSGFLITSVIKRQKETEKGFSFVDFYLRRTLRLLPALMVVCVFTFFFILAVSGLHDAVNEIAPSLMYVSNFTRLTGFPAALANTWSLSVEEQFYFIWPITFILLATFPRYRTVVLLFVVAVAVAMLRAYLFYKGTSLMILYDRPYTHSDGILIGCALAFFTKQTLCKIARFWPIALGYLIYFCTSVKIDSSFAYCGGIFVVNLSAAVMIAKLAIEDGGYVAGFFSARPLVGIGKISYAAYLWHWPLLVAAGKLGFQYWPMMASCFIGGLGFATASWFIIEQPAQRLKNVTLNPTTKLFLASASICLLLVGIVLLSLDAFPVPI
jgi:peptidoglycan/LPS O-acetylase OafA/YrhL